MQRLAEIRVPDYQPSDDDVIRCRVPTSGIQMLDIDVSVKELRSPVPFRVYATSASKFRPLVLFRCCTRIKGISLGLTYLWEGLEGRTLKLPLKTLRESRRKCTE